MHLWLTLTAVGLGAVLPAGLHRLLRHRSGVTGYRAGFLAALGLTSAVAGWWWGNGQVPFAVLPLLPVGAVLGALAATARTSGLVEWEPEPPAADRVRALHDAAGFPPRREPVPKRVFDVVGGALVLAVTLPAWPVVALLIWFEEPGPVLYVRHSVGRDGRVFRQVKFRSMRYGAERGTGPVASPANDPRALRVGRWLRRWHLDELTELLNVLSGSMSLVGPRPLRPVPVLEYLRQVPGYAERHCVRPGIAGIAQIERCHYTPVERLRKDRVYIRCMCLRLDLKLLWRAAVTTVRGRREVGVVPPPLPDVTLGGQPGGGGAATGSAGGAAGR